MQTLASIKARSLKTALLASACLLTAALHAQAPGSSSPQTAAESPNAAFVQAAGQGGMAEVELSKLALAQTQSPQVRQFAQTMVDDHSANNKQLSMIAAHENIQVPQDLDAAHAHLRERIAGESGRDFDRDYVTAMRDDHAKMAELLKSSQATVNTEELRTFIKTTLPVVEHHLEMARGLKIQ